MSSPRHNINKAISTLNALPSSSSNETDKVESKQTTFSENSWFKLISKETDEHCVYLESIGLGERAHYFKVKNFIYQDAPDTLVLDRFQVMTLPDQFHAFDAKEKNTLFTQSDSTQEQEIKRALDIRLYPSMRRIIEKQGATLFLGSKVELQAYSASNKEKLIIEIEVPSSVKFYIALTQTGDPKVYMAGLVSHENLLQQLITLKLAGIEKQKITILGDTDHYKLICKADLAAFEKNASSYVAKRNVLIVAGCSLENNVCTTLDQTFSGKITLQKFSGQIVSLTYALSPHTPNIGFIVLNLNYGEICEEQVAFILEKFNCIGIFSGSAAGYIPQSEEEKLPAIGDRMLVHSARHHSGEVVARDKQYQKLHLHVPTIFVETFKWLEQAKKLGATTVDVETFYILRAVQRFQQMNPHIKLHIDIGVFISDYIGKKPLRSYNNVFARYPELLQDFIKEVLVANITSTHNNNRTTIPTFSAHHIELKPEKIAISQEIKNEAVVDCIGSLWDKNEFYKRVHTPVTIGVVKNKECFISQNVPRCLHLPIKLPGSDIRIPTEFKGFLDELQQIFNFESSINPGWNNLYAYLTVDRGFVPKSNSQRVPGPHVDGIPRDRENPGKQLIDHAYLVTNAIPTMFYTQQFDMREFDLCTHNFFSIFRALSDESRTVMAKPFDIILMDAYSVHTPTQALEDVDRTFIRLEFSTLKFDRVGNSINPHFVSDEKFSDYPFKYVPRPIPDKLFVPASVYLNKPISNQDYSNESIDQFGRVSLQAFYTKNPRYLLKNSDYKDLNLIAKDIMNSETQGIVVCNKGVPHAFALYKVENKTVKLNTLFTLENGKAQEMMILLLRNLKKISERLAIQAGLDEDGIPITIVVNENNEKRLSYFLRAVRLAKIDVNIERVLIQSLQQVNTDTLKCTDESKQLEIKSAPMVKKLSHISKTSEIKAEKIAKSSSKTVWKKVAFAGVGVIGLFALGKYLTKNNFNSNLPRLS